jgi:hypothetical protein
MDIIIVQDIDEAEKIWEKFSSNHDIWSCKDVVFSFYNKKFHKPFFILLKEGEEEKGLIPLWFDSRDNYYGFFGGDYLENQKFWIEPKFFDIIFEKLPVPLKVFDMNSQYVEEILKLFPQFNSNFKKDDFRYFLNTKKFNFDIKEYLKQFGKKHRKNLVYDLKKLELLKYKINFTKHLELETLKNFNIARFGKESDFYDVEFYEEIKKLFSSLEKKNKILALNILIDDKLEAVGVAAVYNGVYYVINNGSNKNIKNLGKLLIFEHIKKGMELRLREVDFLVGDTGWKELWNLEKEPYYTFIKK